VVIIEGRKRRILLDQQHVGFVLVPGVSGDNPQRTKLVQHPSARCGLRWFPGFCHDIVRFCLRL
jgi:hypothetical protein